MPKSQRKHAATFVPPPPSLFERFKSTSLYKILYEVEWKRWLFGDFLVPYTSRRIIKLKERDNVPLLTDLVYNFRLEGTLRIAFFLTNVVTVAGIVGVINVSAVITTILPTGWGGDFGYGPQPLVRKHQNPLLAHLVCKYDSILYLFVA